MADNKTPEDNTVKLKPGTPKAKPTLAPVTASPKPVVVSVSTAVPVASPVKTMVTPRATIADEGLVKKGAVLDQVVERSGIKRSDAKLVMEALFAVMGDELNREVDMQLPPLGKLKFVKAKDVGKGAKAITLKLRTPNTTS
jgi:nucleoid DNA-binding protein